MHRLKVEHELIFDAIEKKLNHSTALDSLIMSYAKLLIGNNSIFDDLKYEDLNSVEGLNEKIERFDNIYFDLIDENDHDNAEKYFSLARMCSAVVALHSKHSEKYYDSFYELIHSMKIIRDISEDVLKLLIESV
ncbi:hypothetical protein U1K26_000963 [Salmonella enterica]|nr:hypothetical protein [Salmonella enterica]EMA0079698.1 hypothetical protein [Salmonella enterica]EMA5860821.1 hypothetical protein [Salmonella enterica]